MITDEYVKELFTNGNKLLAQNINPEDSLPTQFFRGVNPFRVDCMRHMTVFTRFNAIPKFCFNCYKVSIDIQTVVDLFKLMVFFEKVKLPNDNARKCMVECREHVPGSYKGFIYCSDPEEGEGIKTWLQSILSEEISRDIEVKLKRGCSEYAIAYPDYAIISKVRIPMKYKEEWRQYEAIVDENCNFVEQPKTFNQPAYTYNDARVMLAWLKYAAAIGDNSYLDISNEILTPLEGINRP